MCGVFIPQGPKNPMVIETPFPMTAGKFSDEAATVWPPAPVVMPEGGAKKLKRYYRIIPIF